MSRLPADAPLTRLGTETDVVSSTRLHERTRETLDRVRAGSCVTVTHYNAVEGYIVSPEQMHRLIARLNQLESREHDLRDTLPLVLAAARAGVAIPSESLERLLPGLDSSWQAVAEFAAAFPVRISGGEAEEQITRGRLHAHAGRIEDSGDDDELDLDA